MMKLQQLEWTTKATKHRRRILNLTITTAIKINFVLHLPPFLGLDKETVATSSFGT